MKNLDLRQAVEQSGLKYQAIAAAMGVSASWLCRLMKKDLSPEEKIRILSAIQRLRGENVV
jgi:predicted XRE-type DNA-binding protein